MKLPHRPCAEREESCNGCTADPEPTGSRELLCRECLRGAPLRPDRRLRGRQEREELQELLGRAGAAEAAARSAAEEVASEAAGAAALRRATADMDAALDAREVRGAAAPAFRSSPRLRDTTRVGRTQHLRPMLRQDWSCRGWVTAPGLVSGCGASLAT